MDAIRKRWLISFLIILGFTISGVFFINVGIVQAATLIVAALGGITFYFGYIKRGVSWLSLVIGIRTLSILITLIQVLYLAFTKQLSSTLETITVSSSFTAASYAVFWIIDMILKTYYTYNCFQLRKVNLQKKKAA